MLPDAIACAIVAGLTLYAVLGGADFGVGVWELNPTLRASERERAFMHQAMGPVWEANHVWLIFVLIGLFSAFPPAFAALCRALWIPLLLAVVGIMLRGAGFVFHNSVTGMARQRAVWARVFALASTAAPFFLGAAAGAVASGELAVTARGGYAGDYLSGWLSPLSIFSAFFSVGICAYLAAVYLTREAAMEGDPVLVNAWRRRALAAGGGMGALAMAGLAVAAGSAPLLWKGLAGRALPFVGISVLVALFTIWALWRRRFTAAVFGAAATVAAVVWGWSAAQYPALIPPVITVETARGPDAVLEAVLWGIVAGSLIMVPSLVYLFYLFKWKRAAGAATYGNGKDD
ncbi:MAG: cytochrome d ubiquinol oxidase subunit II [Acidobacteriota bacterium]|nr:MAG: cytochrome d ubiquinol oxidase subunit II [Acidobacteriota bacterium]